MKKSNSDECFNFIQEDNIRFKILLERIDILNKIIEEQEKNNALSDIRQPGTQLKEQPDHLADRIKKLEEQNRELEKK